MKQSVSSGTARWRGAGALRGLSTLAAVGLAGSVLLAANTPAEADWTRRAPRKNYQAKREGTAPIKGPVLIAIAIDTQRLTVFDNGVPIASSPVSTGMAGHPTPMGVFSVIQKNKFHRSNIYSDAPMPYMQRITWSGVALHAGVLPGHPASHGCIRMPRDFAVKLWGMTRLGARVVITQHEVTPFAFEHSRLSLLTTRTGDEPSRSGDQRLSFGHAVSAGGGDAKTPPAGVQTADASAMAGTSVLDAGAAKAVASPAAPSADAPAARNEKSASAQPAEPSHESPAADETAAAQSLGAPSALAAAPAVSEATELTATIKVPVPALALPATDVPGPAEPTISDPDALPLDSVFVPPSRPARPLRPGPVSIFVSRKESRLYVRKGFDPLFSVPVTINRPQEPIGTHVFTAADMKDDGATMRWIAVTMPVQAANKAEPQRQARWADHGAKTRRGMDAVPPQAAAEAIDRIDLSPDTVDRLAALMSVGASFIISDHGLGEETGLGTDFIVLTPDGQTIKRTPPQKRPAPGAFLPWGFRVGPGASTRAGITAATLDR